MDNLKIGIRVLGRTRLAMSAALAVHALSLTGCSHAPLAAVPQRAPVCGALVVAQSDESDAYDSMRNDVRLGLLREPYRRIDEGAMVYTYDQQYIFNGRPYTNYNNTTRSLERLSR